MAIPVGDTFIYVEPVYLEAKQEESEQAPTAAPQRRSFGRSQRAAGPGSSQPDRSRAASLPELKRVIIAFGNRLVMEENIDKALSALLGEPISPTPSAFPSKAPTGELPDLGGLALEHYQKAKEYLRQGDWAGYGRELEKLEQVLQKISSVTQEAK